MIFSHKIAQHKSSFLSSGVQSGSSKTFTTTKAHLPFLYDRPLVHAVDPKADSSVPDSVLLPENVKKLLA